jgi:hypothetical protein
VSRMSSPPYAGQTLGAEQGDRYAFQAHTPTAGGAVRQLLFPRTQHLFPDFAVVIEGNGRHEETRTPDLYRVKSSANRLVLACREVLPCGGSSSAVRGATFSEPAQNCVASSPYLYLKPSRRAGSDKAPLARVRWRRILRRRNIFAVTGGAELAAVAAVMSLPQRIGNHRHRRPVRRIFLRQKIPSQHR